MARIVVGTSSWADPGFVEDWYPPGLPPGRRLAWYAEQFEAVELNSSFYSVPHPHVVSRWAAQTPLGFSFDVKLHRLLSRHAAGPESLPPDLREGVETTARGRAVLTPALERALADRFVEAVAPLEGAGKFRAFLLQLTPAFSPKANRLEELDALIERLAPRPVAVELRNRGWVRDQRLETTLGYLAERAAAFVCVDAPPGDHLTIMPAVDAATRADFAYLRLHGRNTDGYLTGTTVAERFGWEYGEDELQEIAGRVRGLSQEVPEIRVFFNNNRGADAPTAARRFREIVGQRTGAPPAEAQGRLL